MSGSRSAEPNVLGGDHTTFKETSAYQLHSPTISTFSARSNRERLNDPSASMLDLDDDPRLSVASDAYDDEQPPPDSNDLSHDNDSFHRLSYLGPNLRFHSRAPWETDDSAFDNDDESSYGIFNSSKKALGFSNPRRPSGESTRSQAKSKQSFETTSSRISYPRGALYALAQESLSTSSLGATTAAPVRAEFPLNRVRSDSPNNIATHSNHSPLTNSIQHETSDTQPSPTSHHRIVYAPNDFHPYANPDLVLQVPEERHHLSPKQRLSRSDSVGTVTDSIAHSALSRSETRSTLAPPPSILSVNARNRASAIQSKEISSPISVINNLHFDSKFHSNEEPFFMHPQPVVENLPGWTERVVYPGFSLISLEEARARKRSATTQPTVPLSSPSSSSPLSDMSHTDVHNLDSRRYDREDGDSIPYSQTARARSVSAGAKAKVALHSIVGGGQTKLEADAGHAKVLKHRKSGFMRLFNGGRGQEKEKEEQSPPPLPSLSPPLSTAQKASKAATYRNPASNPFPSLAAPFSSPGQSPSPVGVVSPVKPSPTPKRPIPPLSINTQPQSARLAAKNDDFQTRTAPFMNVPQPPWLNDPLPQSAPANVSDFPALKLRPVSTAFSVQFGDHNVLPGCRPSLETDASTPASSTRVFSPLTPGSASLSDRSSNVPELAAAETHLVSEDQSSVISALQEQILNATRGWQQQIWELESQVRDLKAEVDDLRKDESEGTFCSSCGRGRRPKVENSPNPPAGGAQDMKTLGVLNRPRARTGTSSRFGSTLS